MSGGVANRPDIVAVLGATGSGKSLYVHAELRRRRPRRLLVWDFSPEDEYAQHCHYVTLGELLAEGAAAGRRGAFALALHPSADPKARARQFDIWCTAAYRLGDCTLVVEELRFVTKPGWSPVPWSQAVLTGRKRGLSIIGTTQRPAHVDKDFLSNATILHCGRLGYDDDVKTAAVELRVRPDQVPTEPLAWVELDRTSGRLTHGRVSVPGLT